MTLRCIAEAAEGRDKIDDIIFFLTQYACFSIGSQGGSQRRRLARPTTAHRRRKRPWPPTEAQEYSR
jgi:hypothetical protein